MLRLSFGEKGVPASLEQSVGEKGKSVVLEYGREGVGKKGRMFERSVVESGFWQEAALGEVL